MNEVGKVNDVITNPVHYDGRYGIECKEAMANMVDRLVNQEPVMNMTPSMAYWWGCAFKYLWRFPYKNAVQDIDKCIECLDNIKRSILDEAISDAEL